MLTVLPLKLSLSASQKPFYLWKSHHNYLQSLAALLRSTSTPLCVQMISLGGAQVSECPPNHQHQHCWVQFRNWFLRLCGLRRPILFLLDTSKYYNLIFTHLSKYIFVLWRFGSDFVVHTSWAKVSVLVITAVVLCPGCPNPQSPPTHSFVADPSALQVPRPAECPTPYEDPCSATHCYFPPASKPLTTTEILFKCHFLCFGISRQQ